MAINGGNEKLANEDLKKVKAVLENSSIYTDISKILNAYEKEQSYEQDDLFSSKNSDGENKFNVVKYTEARGYLNSGKLQKEFNAISDRIKNHKYFMAKNREKDKLALNDLSLKMDKIKEFSSLIETKNDWNQIIEDVYPPKSANSYIHSLPYFIDIFKDLANNMEKTCFRHLDRPDFIKKLNDTIEKDMLSEDSSSEQGRTDYQFVLAVRKEFVKKLESNAKKFNINVEKDNEKTEKESLS